METFLTFVHMGGYAAWVWPAYGLALIGFVGMLVRTLMTLKTREKEFSALKQARQGGQF